ncbi:MAG: hypothetical protein KDA57_09820 [Planctomycetales bacterium]|nr:hypothetical protein [Planctomycetales bacterium]
MRSMLLVQIALCLLLGLESAAFGAQPLWQKLVPRKQVEADPEAEYALTREHGPWLILAATFSGPEAEAQAHELILELRSNYRFPAYYYGMTFQQDETDLGRGVDDYGSRIRRRYQRGNQIQEHAVLVGEFPSVDDPDASKLLQQIKQIAPETLNPEDHESTSQSLATVRQFHNYVREKVGAKNKKGPMGHAFITRNPLLPKEYFVPQGVDEDIAKWNEGLEYTLMKCPGRYSIRVATFQGRTSLQASDEADSNAKTRRASKDDPLVVAGEKAHLLTVALREKGWEAYEFHDRNESYVAVGSFDSGQTLPDGRITLDSRDAQIIYNTFGATSPNSVFNRPAPRESRILEERSKQQFMSMFQNNLGQVSEGFHPKQFVGIPMDIIPQPVQVPRRSISSAYARK